MCTAATYKTKDFYFGRTLDYEFSYGDQIVITPRNYAFNFRHVGDMKNHYAIIGMAHVAEDYPLYYDAMNEKGVAMAGLNFVGNAVYAAIKPDVENIAQFEFIPWILSQCSSLVEVRELLERINIVTKFYNLMMMYRCAIREIQTKLEVLDDEFSVENNRNPISFIKTRIKKPNSIYDKLQKMGYEFTTENIQTYLNDVAGVRIVCAFIDDIYMISDLITQQDDIKVIEIKDYIKNPKSNGYRSYHMIVEIPVFFAKGKTPMRVELQIRTNGMDFWATLEHQLRYKKGIEKMPGYDEISEELLYSARAIIEADNEMQRIKDKIGMFHEI